LQGKFPQHSILFLVKNIFPAGNLPEAGELPSPGREFVEEWNEIADVDRVEKSSVRRVKFLISPPPESRIKDRVGRVAVKIRIARIDPAEISQQ
jgi:hypothetical protein